MVWNGYVLDFPLSLRLICEIHNGIGGTAREMPSLCLRLRNWRETKQFHAEGPFRHRPTILRERRAGRP
jgi:hypothetical protein